MNDVNNNGMFSLNTRDALRGLVVAVLAAVLTWVAQIVNAPGFEFSSFDWGELVRVSVASGAAYMTKNFFSDEKGKVLGTETILGVKQ